MVMLRYLALGLATLALVLSAACSSTANTSGIDVQTRDVASVEQPSGGNDVMSVERPSTGSDVMGAKTGSSVEQPSGGNDVMSVEQPSGGNDVMTTKP